MENQYKQISGRASVTNSSKTATLLTGSANCVIRLVSLHVFVTTSSSGGTGIVTVRDGTGGTVLAQLNASFTAGNDTYDMDFHDGLGYPLTVGNSLSLEVSGATTDADAFAIATGYLTGY